MPGSQSPNVVLSPFSSLAHSRSTLPAFYFSLYTLPRIFPHCLLALVYPIFPYPTAASVLLCSYIWPRVQTFSLSTFSLLATLPHLYVPSATATATATGTNILVP